MPQDTSASLHDPSTPAITRLANTAGHDGPATPHDVAGQLQSGAFFWLDQAGAAPQDPPQGVATKLALIIRAA